MVKICPNCKAKINPNDLYCQYCGFQLEIQTEPSLSATTTVVNLEDNQSTPQFQHPQYAQYTGLPKYRIVGAILAILFGTFGAHKFYMNKTKMGLLYILLFPTGIPTILGLIEGILYFTDTEESFQHRVNPIYPLPPKQPERDRWMAVALAIVFGFCGGHHYFLCDRKGIWYTLFGITGIPWLMSIIEGIIIALEPLQNFELRYGY